MKKKVIIVTAIVAAFAAGAALLPPEANVPADRTEQTVVVAVHTACPQAAPSKVMELTKQPKPITRYAPAETPQPTPEPEEPPLPSELPIPIETPAPMPAPSEPVHSGYGGYVPGFGWIESQGAGTGIIADSIYENGNKVGICCIRG